MAMREQAVMWSIVHCIDGEKLYSPEIHPVANDMREHRET